MTDNTEMQTIYAKTFTPVYEQKQSLLRGTVTTEGEVNGNQFIFIIEGAADMAVERAANGLIPVADDTQTSATLVLKEYHHLARKKNFNIFTSSVPQRLSMQRRGVVAINYRTDQLILEQLNTSSYNTGGAATASLALLMTACTKLDENFVPDDGERYGLLTPMAWAQMMKVNQFSSGDWVPDKPFMKYMQWRQWNGVKWAKHPNLPGKGGAAAKCFVYHKSAVGHGLNQGEIQTKIGVNDEFDYSFARATSYQNAKMIQDEGVVIITHNDSTALS